MNVKTLKTSSRSGARRCAAALAALSLCAAPLGCSQPVQQATTAEEPIVTRTDFDTGVAVDTATAVSFDPLGLTAERAIVPQLYRDSFAVSDAFASDDLSGADGADAEAVGLSLDSAEAYDTYRIQLFNSRAFTEASLERRIAQEIFDYTVTLDYEVPYFKVRLGDFADFKDAELYLRDFVKPAGYPESWVARVRVLPARSNPFESALQAFFDSLRTEIAIEELAADSAMQPDTSLDDTLEDQ